VHLSLHAAAAAAASTATTAAKMLRWHCYSASVSVTTFWCQDNLIHSYHCSAAAPTAAANKLLLLLLLLLLVLLLLILPLLLLLLLMLYRCCYCSCCYDCTTAAITAATAAISALAEQLCSIAAQSVYCLAHVQSVLLFDPPYSLLVDQHQLLSADTALLLRSYVLLLHVDTCRQQV
jgi:hypothetical protein